MEKAIEKLGVMEKQLLAMNILEEYTVDEIARLLAYNPSRLRKNSI
jgi:DNA-directed RNA polymerase specialized sigma24 family protein